MQKSSKVLALAVALASAGSLANAAHAAIVATYELRETGTDAKSIAITSPNQVVHLSAYIQIVNNDANHDNDSTLANSISFDSVDGSVPGRPGLLLGNYSNGLRNTALFPDGTAPTNGTANNLDANADLEWGVPPGNSTAGAMNPFHNGFVVQTGTEILLGTIDWTAPPTLIPGSSTALNVRYYRNLFTGRGAATVISDGVDYHTTTGAIDVDTLFANGTPVNLIVQEVPEPASLSLWAFGGWALLARRRKTS